MVLGLKEIHIGVEIHANVDYTIDLLNVSEYRDNKIHMGWLDNRIAMQVRAERPPWYLSVVGGALYVPPVRGHDQLLETSRVSARERLGPRGVTSKVISRNIHHEPQPFIHLGGEVQSEANRGHRISIRQEEEEGPPHRVPAQDRLSEGICTHHPQPTRPAIQPIRHYVTKEHMDQRIKELIEAQVLGTVNDITKLLGSLICKELFDMEIPKGFHTLQNL
ncbi:hypothetical protein GIB67_020482 [Kingdonia uniflora]|uniref:Uncharacterized protein n=1 Tax=Kingdonia uniflora TaxID=39325 RepID=A0A7J7LV07_9MAGN|nr:hypothetical protein GIB67_020482 [Kingdonia uniflora]